MSYFELIDARGGSGTRSGFFGGNYPLYAKELPGAEPIDSMWD